LVEDYKEGRRKQPSRKDPNQKVSAARVNRELDTWKQAMKVAIEWDWAAPVVLGAFVKIREPRPQPHQIGLTRKQIDAFLKAETHAGYLALFRTVVGTGMRDDEARHMEESDIQPPWIVVTPKPGWTTKGYRYRSIPASDATVKAARAFVKAKAKLNLDQKAIWKRIQAARKTAGIPLHFSMHDLRRAWASHMLAAGHRIEEISKWLGHADIMTTMRYLRVVTIDAPNPETLPF
jgi:integrase